MDPDGTYADYPQSMWRANKIKSKTTAADVTPSIQFFVCLLQKSVPTDQGVKTPKDTLLKAVICSCWRRNPVLYGNNIGPEEWETVLHPKCSRLLLLSSRNTASLLLIWRSMRHWHVSLMVVCLTSSTYFFTSVNKVSLMRHGCSSGDQEIVSILKLPSCGTGSCWAPASQAFSVCDVKLDTN